MSRSAATLAPDRPATGSAYQGVLDDAHIRAVIREALRAHSFEPDPGDLAGAFADQWRLGVLLRDRLIPTRLAPFVEPEVYRSLETASPYLWARLPHMAALGFRQARAIEALAGTLPDDQDAAVLAATFNIAIAFLDHAVDDLGAAQPVFALVDRVVVRSMFESRDGSAATLTERYRAARDPLVRLLIAFIASCVEQGWALHARRGNSDAWRALGEMVGRMFEAERLVSNGAPEADGSNGDDTARTDRPGPAERSTLIQAVRDKSVLPSMATLGIVALASPDPGAVAGLEDVAGTLGAIFSLVDDLADVLHDSRASRVTVVTSRLESVAASGGRRHPADADVYDVVDAATGEVIELLARLEDLAHQRARTTGGSADEVIRFGREAVAAWSGWHEDPALLPTARPDAARASENGKPPRRADEAIAPSATLATSFLLEQQRAGYPEAAHHLHFPRLTSAGTVYETHPALLAQRSVVLDALLDAHSTGIDVPRVVLASEVLTILRSKHRGVRGGWSYIAEVPELPPDADDVGQVLQELWRIGGPVLASTCDEGIRFVLDAARADGAFATWILDPRGRSPADELARRYLPIMGGAGIHPEVIANLLYGLSLYDPRRYAGPLARSASFLESVQSEDGSWASKWYEGPYYGTFRVLWVLGSLQVGERAIARAREFLLGTQRPSGGWGHAAEEPLSTALAMLSLAAPNTSSAPEAIRRGAAYLGRTADQDGGWASAPWIVFPTADGEESYGSRTISTAFCLKALLASGSTRT